MKYFIIIVSSIFFISGFLPALEVSAQVDTKATGPGISTAFVKCGGTDDNGNKQPPCTIKDLIGKDGLIQRALNWVFMMVGFFGAILFMYAGFLLITSAGNPAQINKARGIFKNVVIGLIIILGAVVIVGQLLDYLDAKEFKNIITQEK